MRQWGACRQGRGGLLCLVLHLAGLQHVYSMYHGIMEVGLSPSLWVGAVSSTDLISTPLGVRSDGHSGKHHVRMTSCLAHYVEPHQGRTIGGLHPNNA